VVTTSATRASGAGPSGQGSPVSQGSQNRPARPAAAPGGSRPLIVTGIIGAGVAAAAGLAVLILVVLVGWIAAPHNGQSLTGVLRTASLLWLIGHHVGFALPGAGRIGMLPLGLVLLPGALLWRAGRWVVRAGGVARLRYVGYAALALAVPYALAAGVLALASRSAQATPSAPQAVLCGFLLALIAGGLGGARALAPWPQLTRLLPDRPRSVIIGVVGALAVLAVSGAVLAGASLATHVGEYDVLSSSLQPGAIGSVLLLVTQLAYVPNAIVWAVSFTLGPGFAFGTGTIVAPTGAALGQLPAFPLLAALPQGMHNGAPAWLTVIVLALPYLSGCAAGLLLVRAAPFPALEAAPLWGLACGAAAGGVLGILAAFSGGPLGDGRLAAVGPSGWQVGAIAALEIGVASAVTAGIVNWLRLGRRGRPAGDPAVASGPPVQLPRPRPGAEDGDAHTIYLDPWAGDEPSEPPPAPRGPSSLP
jgi:putative intracellular protease/amidase